MDLSPELIQQAEEEAERIFDAQKNEAANGGNGQ